MTRASAVPVAGVIFDLDGTLLDTLADLAHAHNYALEQLGLPAHPVGAYREFIGNGARRCVERSLPQTSRHPEIVERCLGIMREVYGGTWDVHTKPYPGVEDLLAVLKERGTTVSVLSNKDDGFAKRCVARLLPRIPFDMVRGAADRSRLKPDPAGALAIAEELGHPPSTMALVGDSAVDIETARNAGMLAVGCLWGFRSEAELASAGAEVLISRPNQLLTAIT